MVFTFPFTAAHRDIISSLQRTIVYGGDKAIADSRGSGKSSIFRCLTILNILYGRVKYPILFGAGLRESENNMKAIKTELQFNDMLFADFPEACAPIRALGGENRKAFRQTCGGVPTHIWWGTEKLVMPVVTDSKSAGSVMEFRSPSSGFRGCFHSIPGFGTLRPDLALIDDVETRESADSEKQREFIEAIIEGDIAGAAGMGKKLSRVYLCTVWSRESKSYKYTGVAAGWGGKRYRLLTKFPNRLDLWEVYVQMRRDDRSNGDEYGRRAFRFYQQHFDEMDEGAEVSNPHRHVTAILEDGTPTQLTTLQFCYDFIADHDDDADPMRFFNEEFQNDPPSRVKENVNELTAHAVSMRLSGYQRKVVPADVVRLTQFIDVQKNRLYWVVVGWTETMRGYVVDYGVENFFSNDESDQAIEMACLAALHVRRTAMLEKPYQGESGENVAVDLTLVDSGYALLQNAVYLFVAETGGVSFRASKGYGASDGNSFHQPLKPAPDKRLGDHWYLSRQPSGIWLTNIDVDYWKHRVHERFTTPVDKPGAITLFGDPARLDFGGKPADAKDHRAFSHHVVAEVWREKPFDAKKGAQFYWHKRSDANHWFDGLAACCVAASILGVKLLKSDRPKADEPSGDWFAREKEASSSGWFAQETADVVA